MKINNYINKSGLVALRGTDDIEGILLGVGKQFSILKFIPCDFITDGIVLINNNYVLNFIESDSIVDTILKLKQVNFNEKMNLELGNYEKLFDSFLRENRLIQFSTDDPDVSYIGSVIKVNKRSFRLRMLSTKGKWLDDYSFQYTSIRNIHLENDYLCCWDLYLKNVSNP